MVAIWARQIKYRIACDTASSNCINWILPMPAPKHRRRRDGQIIRRSASGGPTPSGNTSGSAAGWLSHEPVGTKKNYVSSGAGVIGSCSRKGEAPSLRSRTLSSSMRFVAQRDYPNPKIRNSAPSPKPPTWVFHQNNPIGHTGRYGEIPRHTDLRVDFGSILDHD